MAGTASELLAVSWVSAESSAVDRGLRYCPGLTVFEGAGLPFTSAVDDDTVPLNRLRFTEICIGWPQLVTREIGGYLRLRNEGRRRVAAEGGAHGKISVARVRLIIVLDVGLDLGVCGRDQRRRKRLARSRVVTGRSDAGSQTGGRRLRRRAGGAISCSDRPRLRSFEKFRELLGQDRIGKKQGGKPRNQSIGPLVR